MAVPQHIAEFRYCWICTGEFADPWPRKGDLISVDCATCGKYVISSSLYASAFPLPEHERYRVSYAMKRRQLEGRDAPKLTQHTMPAMIADLPNPATHEKPTLLLSALTLLHSVPGALFNIDDWRERSLACARDDNEMAYFIRSLIQRGDLADHGAAPGGRWLITRDGWERAARLAARPNVSRAAFVALHFTKEVLDLYASAFAPAIERAGFQPSLANNPAHNEQIDARIVTLIRQSRFVVADVTGARTGVYFEAGYALGHGRPVIWTCRESSQADMHFDTRQYNHILWKEGSDLKEQLYLRIAATI
jgi:hypothetical protein